MENRFLLIRTDDDGRLQALDGFYCHMIEALVSTDHDLPDFNYCVEWLQNAQPGTYLRWSEGYFICLC